jgi:hypothetical protein
MKRDFSCYCCYRWTVKYLCYAQVKIIQRFQFVRYYSQNYESFIQTVFFL